MDILQSVMDSSSHAMFTMDRQGIVTHINQQAKEPPVWRSQCP